MTRSSPAPASSSPGSAHDVSELPPEPVPPLRYWCELAWLGGESADAGVLLTVQDGRIEAVEPRAAAARRTPIAWPA